jgi:RNA polymerase subunit RPABC4/transcription elongation factor Spt4
MFCTNCGTELVGNINYCPKCGNKLEVDNVENKSIPIDVNAEIVCSNCGEIVPSHKGYCIECGAVLESSENNKKNHNSLQKPISIVMAVNLLWISLGLGLLKLIIDYSNLSSMASTQFINIIIFLSFVLLAIFIFNISEGKNWARMTFLIFFIVGLLPYYPIILGELSRSSIIGILSLSQSGLQLISLFLIFTHPGSIWFNKDRTIKH